MWIQSSVCNCNCVYVYMVVDLCVLCNMWRVLVWDSKRHFGLDEREFVAFFFQEGKKGWKWSVWRKWIRLVISRPSVSDSLPNDSPSTCPYLSTHYITLETYINHPPFVFYFFLWYFQSCCCSCHWILAWKIVSQSWVSGDCEEKYNSQIPFGFSAMWTI